MTRKKILNLGLVIGFAWLAKASTSHSEGVTLQNNLTCYGDNTEFFEPFRVRETILGQQFKSYLNAESGDHASLWGGLFADHRSALESETRVLPILSFVYRSGEAQGIFGTLLPTERHGLIEPMEVTTLELTRPVEYGLEWIQKSSGVVMDAFLDWHQLLTPTDREIFDYGGSGALEIIPGIDLEGQCHGYHVGGAQYGGVVRNNLAGGAGFKFYAPLAASGGTSLELLGLGSKDTNRPFYPGPELGYGLYANGTFSPDGLWDFFGIVWLGKDFLSEEGDSNYNSLGADGVYYQSERHYEEVGIRRKILIDPGVTFDLEVRSHWIEDSWANSFRIVAQIPFDVDLGIQRRPASPESAHE